MDLRICQNLMHAVSVRNMLYLITNAGTALVMTISKKKTKQKKAWCLFCALQNLYI